ncbi:MAG: META domain-containing protein [Acidimicrobiia bacterium]
MLAVTLLVASSCTASIARDVEGTWEVTGFNLDGAEHDVTVGVNTVSTPWVAIKDGQLTGSAGCNDLEGPVVVADSSSLDMTDVVMSAVFCAPNPEDDSLMQVDFAFEAVIWGAPVDVTTNGDTMVWTHGDNSITFVSVASPPG